MLMSERENVACGFDVAAVEYTALGYEWTVAGQVKNRGCYHRKIIRPSTLTADASTAQQSDTVFMPGGIGLPSWQLRSWLPT